MFAPASVLVFASYKSGDQGEYDLGMVVKLMGHSGHSLRPFGFVAAVLTISFFLKIK